MPINSRAKGKRGELEAVKYLKGLGFADARRTQQFCGKGKGDVECPESLPGLHFEVKFGYPIHQFDLGTSLLREACQQAARDAGHSSWVVLWKPKGVRKWRLTIWDEWTRGYATFADDVQIRDLLKCFVVDEWAA